tara:strand:+ start:1376 stop:3604 length:2229 start_codon:yes stop_codon:yes gene_type:complete
MNKVLNRPLFRKAALKKGYIKPIKAFDGRFIGPMPFSPPAVTSNTGIMVGQPRTSPQVPALRKPPSFLERLSVRPSARLLKEAFSIPVSVGFQAGDKVADAFGMDPGFNVGRVGLQTLGSVAAARALPGLAVGSIGAIPTLVGLGTLYGIQNRIKAGIDERKRIKAMSPAELAEFKRLNRARALGGEADVSEQDLLGNFVPKPKKKETTKIATQASPGAGRPGFKGRDKSLQDMGPQDQLADQQYAGAGEADLNKIQGDTIGPNLPDPRDQVKVAVAEVEQPKQPKTTIEKAATKDINKSTANTIQTGGASDDPVFNQNIKLARQYFDELNKGQSSQAKLIFLSNLASGLLTGTTTRGGIGGALEVFGQALGPAVNNMVTVKLKEGELRARRRETSLNAALEHMEFINQGAARPDIDDRGVIQIRGEDGVLKNYRGVFGKDGTAYLFGGLGADGREVLIPIQQQGNIVDSNGNVLGSFEDFKSQKDLGARLFDLQDILGNRYNALSVTRDVLKTLGQEDMQGEKPKAGAALTVDTFVRRFTGVVKELAGANVMDDISTLTESQLQSKLDQYYQRELQAIERSDLSDKEKEKAREEIDKDSLLKAARDRLKKRGLFSGLSREEQEKLAVQETTLVYALANTFKDQDRLTQRDINAAREIVNIFSLRRSSKDVEASIKAIGQQLESDIRRTESLYREAGGLEATILRLRKLAEFETFGQGAVPQTLFKDFTPAEIEEGLQGVQL